VPQPYPYTTLTVAITVLQPTHSSINLPKPQGYTSSQHVERHVPLQRRTPQEILQEEKLCRDNDDIVPLLPPMRKSNPLPPAKPHYPSQN
jgi:hypothetical protein